MNEYAQKNSKHCCKWEKEIMNLITVRICEVYSYGTYSYVVIWIIKIRSALYNVIYVRRSKAKT